MYMHVSTVAVYRSSQYANMSNVYVQCIRNCADLLVFLCDGSCLGLRTSMFFFLLCAVCERVKNMELKQVREVQDRPCSDPQNRGEGMFFPTNVVLQAAIEIL